MKKPTDVIIPEGMKWCACDLHGDNVSDHILPLDDFAIRTANKTDGRQAECKKCRKQHDHDRNKDRMDEIVAHTKEKRHKRTKESRDMKIGLKCARCGFEGTDDTHMCLVYHHVKPEEKSFSIADAMRDLTSMSKIKEEMKKCVVVCSNCHAIITYHNTQYINGKITREDVYRELEKVGMKNYLII